MCRFSIVITRPIALLMLALVVGAAPMAAQGDASAPSLEGSIKGRTYISPTGVFEVTIPVLRELGGRVTDTPNVVTFEDAFNTHVSIAAFRHDATQRWELSTRGLQDYLNYFFTNFVVADFGQVFADVQIESSKIYRLAGLQDGALIAYLLIPGGTMFEHKIAALPRDGRLPVAKRGNLLFVKNGHTFVISIELAERVIEGKAYTKTTAEEDALLQQRLEDVVAKMRFPTPPTGGSAAASEQK